MKHLIARLHRMVPQTLPHPGPPARIPLRMADGMNFAPQASSKWVETLLGTPYDKVTNGSG